MCVGVKSIITILSFQIQTFFTVSTLSFITFTKISVRLRRSYRIIVKQMSATSIPEEQCRAMIFLNNNDNKTDNRKQTKHAN